MRIVHALAVAAIVIPGAALAQRAADLGPIDVTAAVGDIGPGWIRKQVGAEGVTFVCESDACGGRGVVGIGQATPSPDYVKQVVADPQKAMPSYRYGTEESIKPTGCKFATFDVRRLNDRRVQYESVGACPEGAAAAMTTIFDADRGGMMSVQVLTKNEAEALRLRDASIGKIVAALDRGDGSSAER